MLAALLTLGALAALIGIVLGYSAIRFRVDSDPVVERIDALLPQTQCGQCTYAGCRPYAEAIAAGEADINQCPPGGETTIQALADLLGVDPKPLNPEHGEHKEKTVVTIDENVCIGCTLCIQACPVDAILGAAKQMHTVITSECTGCNLCIPPCPVECIHIVPVRRDIGNWIWPLRPARPYSRMGTSMICSEPMRPIINWKKSTGVIKGSVTRQNTCQSFAPSILAAANDDWPSYPPHPGGGMTTVIGFRRG